MMNFIEAAEKWEVSEKTVVTYICKGYIYGLQIEDDEVLIPNIPKPYVTKQPKTTQSIDKYILKTMEKCCYVNPKIMNISKEKFEERLRALLEADKIFVVDKTKEDFSTNLNFALTYNEKSTNAVSIDVQLSSNISIKVAEQIGLINGKLG
ncbi:MAG: hypothetical protein E7591_10055 [Ruminococcaceae bacterium]|nr:hypothetical protein [Oscillospiraceae bacterium]